MQSAEIARTHKRQLYALLHVAEEDLRQAAYFGAYISKKGWHFEPWERRWSVYMQQAAFTTAFATAYSRPFVEVRGWPKFPARLLSALSPEQRKLHKRILKLRNLVYAHSDALSRIIRPVSIDGYPTAIEALPAMRFSREEIGDIQSMIAILRKSVATRKRELLPDVESEA